MHRRLELRGVAMNTLVCIQDSVSPIMRPELTSRRGNWSIELKIRIALAWLDPADWPKWQEVDPSLPPYNEWLLKVEARYRDAYQRGVQFEVIRLDPDVFASWCKAKGCAPGEAARAEYATAALAKRPR